MVVDPDDPETLYVGSHEGVSISRDGGETWQVEETLRGADAMGWAFTQDSILVGGHPGISVSADGGATFELRNEGLPATDIHALGAGDGAVYAASPAAGLLASTDGGESWEVHSADAGQAFMGRILVDPSEGEHLIATDMQAGAVESDDAGRTWDTLGGVQGAMWVTWDETDTNRIIVTGAGTAAMTTDGGKSWERLDIPEGASVVEFSPHDPGLLFAAVHHPPQALIYKSTDGGETWARP
jgi:photosystem II stability/assembly factor-like uncharacterized protein